MSTTLDHTLAEQFSHAGAHSAAWINDLRAAAMKRFQDAGFPTTRQEAWRDTNLAPLIQTTFRPAAAVTDAATKGWRDCFGFGRRAAAEIVFVNGHFVPEWSDLANLPRGVKVMPLAQAIDAHAALLQRHLGRYAAIDGNPFVAINQSFLRDGAFLQIARGALIEKPIHILCLGMPGTEPTVCHPRTLIVAEENCEATLVETFAGSDAGVYFTNAVTEIIAAPTARLDHCRLQYEGRKAFHISTMHVQLDTQASFVSHAATLGGQLTRNELNVILNGERAEATLNGLVILNGQQHCDNHTLLHHEKPNCPSHELYKHVLADKATGVFKGQIFVQQGANGTDAKQTSKSLVLSDTALMNSQPALEIYADDVKCTHGSTIGPVDESAVFYLQSRGLSYEAARHLLTYAFAADITRRIRVLPVRSRIEDYMASQHGLPQDLRITDQAEAQTPLM